MDSYINIFQISKEVLLVAAALTIMTNAMMHGIIYVIVMLRMPHRTYFVFYRLLQFLSNIAMSVNKTYF